MGALDIHTEQLVIVTAGSTTTTTLTVFSKPIDGRQADKVRFALRLLSNTGKAKVRPRVQTSDDGVTWTTAAALSSYSTYVDDDGWTYGTAFDDVPDAPHVRFGLQAVNDSGTKTEAVRANVWAHELSHTTGYGHCTDAGVPQYCAPSWVGGIYELLFRQMFLVPPDRSNEIRVAGSPTDPTTWFDSRNSTWRNEWVRYVRDGSTSEGCPGRSEWALSSVQCGAFGMMAEFGSSPQRRQADYHHGFQPTPCTGMRSSSFYSAPFTDLDGACWYRY